MQFNKDIAKSFARQSCKLCNGKGYLEYVPNHVGLSDRLFDDIPYRVTFCYKSGCSLSKLEKLKKLNGSNI
jgi:hypothetical protein